MMSNSLELIVQELQNRIGQITSNYELQMAMLKSQAMEEIQKRDEIIKNLQAESEEIIVSDK
jgi:uncharacterized protein YbjQ (UPF0145 family)